MCFSRSSLALSEVLRTLLSQPDGHTEGGHCSKAHVAACFIKKQEENISELQNTKPPCPSPSPEVAQVHVHCVGDAIQSSHPLKPPSPPALNLSQHQGLFQ